MFDPAALGTAMIGLRATLADLDAAQSPARPPGRPPVRRQPDRKPARARIAGLLRLLADAIDSPRRSLGATS